MSDAGAADEVCLFRQSLFPEVLLAGFHHAGVLRVDVAHEKPRADAVAGQCGTEVFQYLLIVDEQRFRLPGRVTLVFVHAHFPEVAVSVVFRHDHPSSVGHLAAFLQVNPHGDFAAVERRLLDDGDGAVGFLPHERLLVGGIAQEIALQDGSRTGNPWQVGQPPLAFVDAGELSFEEFAARFHVQDGVEFPDFSLWGEGGVRVYEAPKTETRMSTADDDISAQVTVKGETLRVTYPVDLIDFHEGRIHQFVVKRRTMCRCPDAGFFCQKCNGRPTIGETVNLTLAVERGADEGTVVVFKNAGDVSEMNNNFETPESELDYSLKKID